MTPGDPAFTATHGEPRGSNSQGQMLRLVSIVLAVVMSLSLAVLLYARGRTRARFAR